MLTNEELGRKIELLREYRKITRKNFAQKLNFELGSKNALDEGKIYRMENGKKSISAILLFACSKVLEVDIRLFGENINNLLSTKNLDGILIDYKSELKTRIKINNLTKVLDKISDEKIYNKFLSFLESFEKN